MRQRVRSEQGASLSMALMVFLVVTTVAAIVLSAATAVSGRLSQLADMDRSYYNVTSVAKLFWDELGGGVAGEGVTVNVTRGCDVTQADDGTMSMVVGTATLAIDDVVFSKGPDGETLQPKLDASNASLFQVASADLLFHAPLNVSPGSRAYGCEIKLAWVADSIDATDLSPTDIDSRSVSYTPFLISSNNTSSKIKPVSVTLTLSEDGSAQFLFSEEDTANDPSSFRCEMLTTVGVSDSAPHISDLGENKYHVEWITTVSWDAESLAAGGGSYGS